MNQGWVRIVIIAAAAVTGILLIANGFDGPTIADVTEPTPTTPAASPTESASPTPTATETETESPPPANCRPQGVQVGVYNATDANGLAAAAAARFVEAGYTVDPDVIDDAESASNTTIVYFRTQQDRRAAQCLAARELEGLEAEVQALPGNTSIPDKVQVAVILGSDYAAMFPVG